MSAPSRNARIKHQLQFEFNVIEGCIEGDANIYDCPEDRHDAGHVAHAGSSGSRRRERPPGGSQGAVSYQRLARYAEGVTAEQLAREATVGFPEPVWPRAVGGMSFSRLLRSPPWVRCCVR